MPITAFLFSMAWGSPATVLQHDVAVRFDNARRQTRAETWVVRVDEPEACAGGLPAPAFLAGATADGAIILDDTLVFPDGLHPGQVFSFHREVRDPRSVQSGTMSGAASLPVEAASLSVRAPSWIPLTVWADERAMQRIDTGRRQDVAFEWAGMPPGTPPLGAWSLHTDWSEVDTGWSDDIGSQLAPLHELPRQWSYGVKGLGVAGIAEKVWDEFEMRPGGSTSWEDAAPVTEVAKRGWGSAPERGLLLLSLLKASGFDARPARVRPATAAANLPNLVPVPSEFTLPMVVVAREGRRTTIDVNANHVSTEDMPVQLLGGSLWLAGERPYQPSAPSFVDGTVSIRASTTLQESGTRPLHATLTATGPAREALRARLQPLSGAARSEAFQHLLAEGGHPNAVVEVDADGLDRPTGDLRIVVSGRIPTEWSRHGPGRIAKPQALLASAIASWLPVRAVTHETQSVRVDSAWQIVDHEPPQAVSSSHGWADQRWTKQADRFVLHSRAQRLDLHPTPGEEIAFKDHVSRLPSPRLTLLPSDARSTAKAIRGAEDLSVEERAILEALHWKFRSSPKRAIKTLERAEVPTHRLQQSDAPVHHHRMDVTRPPSALTKAYVDARVDPTDTDALIRLRDLALAEGRLADAIWSAETLANGHPTDDESRTILASLNEANTSDSQPDLERLHDAVQFAVQNQARASGPATALPGTALADGHFANGSLVDAADCALHAADDENVPLAVLYRTIAGHGYRTRDAQHWLGTRGLSTADLDFQFALHLITGQMDAMQLGQQGSDSVSRRAFLALPRETSPTTQAPHADMRFNAALAAGGLAYSDRYRALTAFRGHTENGLPPALHALVDDDATNGQSVRRVVLHGLAMFVSCDTEGSKRACGIGLTEPAAQRAYTIALSLPPP